MQARHEPPFPDPHSSWQSVHNPRHGAKESAALSRLETETELAARLVDWSTDCLTARLGGWLVGRWVDCWLADPLVAKTNVKRCLFSRIFHFDCAPDDGGSCGSFVVVAGVSLSRSPCGNMQLLLLLLLQPLGYCLFTHVSITQSASRRGNIIWGPT